MIRMKHQLLAPRWRGESAALRRATGHQSFGGLRTGSKGRKASTPGQTEPHVEQVATDNESGDAYVRAVMENLPTKLARALFKRQAAGPKKGKVSRPYKHAVYGIYPKGTRCKASSLRPAQGRLYGHAKWTGGTVEPANGSHLAPRRVTDGVSRRPGRMPWREGWLKKRMLGCNGRDMLT